MANLWKIPKYPQYLGDILGFYMGFSIYFHDVFFFLPTTKWPKSWMGKPQVGLADDHESSAADRSSVSFHRRILETCW